MRHITPHHILELTLEVILEHVLKQLMWLSGRPMLLVAEVRGSIPAKHRGWSRRKSSKPVRPVAGSESRIDAKYHMSSHFASLANIKFVLRAMRDLV